MPPHSHGHHSHGHHISPHRFRGRDSHFYLYEEPQCYCDGVPCLCPPLDTAGLFRDPILPKGFYWYDAPPAQAPGFNLWLMTTAPLGVKVRKSVTAADTDPLGAVVNGHVWALFEVTTNPVPWLDATKFGFPNTATASTDSTVVSSGADPQKGVLDQVADSVKGIPKFLGDASPVVLIGGAIGLGIYFFRKELFSYGQNRVRKFQSSRGRRAKS